MLTHTDSSVDFIYTLSEEFLSQFPKATRYWGFPEGTCPFCFKKGFMIFVDRPMQRSANVMCARCNTSFPRSDSYEKFMKEKPPKPLFDYDDIDDAVEEAA